MKRLLRPLVLWPLAALGHGQAPSVVDLTPTPPPNATWPVLVDASGAVSGLATEYADPGSGRGIVRIDLLGRDPADPGDASKVGPPDGILDLVQLNSNSPALPLGVPPGSEVLPAVAAETFPCLILRGEPDGTFTDVTAATSPGSTSGFDTLYPCGAPWGALAGDFDLDGDNDLYFSCGGFYFESPNAMFANDGDGTFTNITASVGITFKQATFSSTALDYDRDGDLDLYEANSVEILSNFWLGGSSPNPSDRLWRNEDGATFTEVAGAAGVNLPSNGFSCAASDLDRDGWLDVVVSCFRQFNKLFYNDGDGTFSFLVPEGSPLGPFALGDLDPDPQWPGSYDFPTLPLGYEQLPVLGTWSMPVSLADFNGDGWLDVLYSCWSNQLPDGNDTSALGAQFFPFDRSRLYLNRGDQDGDGAGDGLFREVAAEVGLDHVGGCMGQVAADFDGDGYLDVYLGGGGPQLEDHVEEDYLYVNDGPSWPTNFQADPDQPLPKIFYEVGALAGTYANVYMSHGIVTARSNAGRLDVLVGNGGPAIFGDGQPNVYFRNQGNASGPAARYLSVELEPTSSVAGAVGTRVSVVRDGASETGRVVTDERSGPAAFGSQNAGPVHLGLGSDDALYLGVRWPSGVRSGKLFWPAVQGNGSVTVEEPTLSMAFDFAYPPGGGVDLALRLEAVGPDPEFVHLGFLGLVQVAPGAFAPLLLFELLPPAVYFPGAPLDVTSNVPGLPAGLYGVFALQPLTSNIVGSALAWHDPALATSSAPPPTVGSETSAGLAGGPEVGAPDERAADRRPRERVAPRERLVVDTPLLSVARARTPLVWESVPTLGRGHLVLPSGERVSWDHGLVTVTFGVAGGSELSFASDPPLLAVGVSGGCCDVRPADKAALVRFDAVGAGFVVDGVEYSADGHVHAD